MGNVLIVAELFESKVKKPTHSAITFAKQAASALGGTYSILALGSGIDAAAKDLAGFGAAKVLVADAASLAKYYCEAFAPTVAKVAKDGGFEVVVSAADNFGKDLMPRVAERLGAGVASDIAGVAGEGGKLVYKRPTYAGNVMAYMRIETKVQVVTVRQTEFDAAAAGTGQSPIEKVGVEPPSVKGKDLTGFEKVVSARPELTEARVVVSGGRGLKAAENFKMLEQLTDLLGGALGATRAAVDAGFVPNDLQVGQTGKIVAPELYMAVGLSGALQHLAGMKGSKTIVAINKDEEAPIFTVADYGLVADLFQAVPAMIADIKK